MNLVVAAGMALVLVNSIVYIKGMFDLNDSALAIAYAAFGAGSLLVALATPRLVDAFGVSRTMFTGATVVVIGLAGALIFTVLARGPEGHWWPILLVWALLGAGTSMINTPSARLLLAASTEDNRNLVYTAQFALSHACFLLGYPVAGWLGAESLAAAVGALLAIAVVAVVTGARLRRRLDERHLARPRS